MTAPAWVAVGALGGGMAIARFLLDGAVASRLGGDFPVGTLAVNLRGAVVLGVLAGAALSGSAYTIVAGGGVGTYTTFSTWMLESHRAGEGGDARVLWANIAVSLVAGLAADWALDASVLSPSGRLLAGNSARASAFGRGGCASANPIATVKAIIENLFICLSLNVAETILSNAAISSEG